MRKEPSKNYGGRMIVLTLLGILELWGQCFGSEFYADNGLQQTVLIDQKNPRRREEVQQEILTLLGLHQRPRPNQHGEENSARQFMIDLYKKLQDEDGEDISDETEFQSRVNLTLGKTVIHINGTDVIRSFVNHANKVPHLRHDKDCTFFFDTSDVSSSEQVTGSEFRIYKEAKKQRGSDCLIEIFRISQGADPEDKTLEPEANLTASWDYEGWLNFNVTNAVYLWSGLPYTNLGLYMRVRNLQNNQVIDTNKFGLVGRRGPEDKQAFMVGFFNMRRDVNFRHKRSTSGQSKNSTPNEKENYYYWGGDSYSYDNYRRTACQRHTLFVSFASLGWQDWIIAPEGFAAFYCGGQCSFPLGAHMNATNHAIVQTLVHLTKPYAVPKPCCAPTKLSSIQVLYFDDKSNVILQRYKNMRVKACGCH